MAEAQRIYAADADALEAAPAPRPFADFVAWLDANDNGASQAYWTDLLHGFTVPTGLPAAAFHSGSGQARQTEHSLSVEATARLVGMARNERLTLNTTVLGAWALLLARYNDSDDVVFGGTMAGRPVDLDGADRMAGLFINTLPIRVSIPAETGCASWLRDIQAQQQASGRFEQTALVDVQRWSDVPAGRALFDTIVVFENFPSNTRQDGSDGALAIRDEQYLEYSNFPLALLAVPEDSLRLIAVFDPRRFDDGTIDRLLRQLATILDAFASIPERCPADVSLLPAAEYRRVIEQWNDTRVEFPACVAIQELFEECVERAPRAAAVAFDDEVIDYQTLDARANRLAHLLRERGVGRDVCVPVFMERSADAIIGILAVLKAGGAYVPVDANFPAQRLEFLLDDLAACAVPRTQVITHASLAERLEGADVDIICLDRDSAEVERYPATKPVAPTTPDALAYVIYTSGSTGRPKGVMVSHHNLVNSTLARPEYYPEPLSAYMLLSSLATDSSVAGIFWALCTGALLVLPRGRQEQELERLGALVAQYGASHLLAVPSLYNLMLETEDRSCLASIRAVIVAGEACAAEIVARHEELLPEVTLYNEYGPTEGTVWATVARLDRSPGPVTIGRPIANVSVYILDRSLRPVPLGVAGELCIGGAGVARGYLNRPDATAAKFPRDPFSDDPAARLYLTGDRARYRDDGRIEFLGRIDHQIKIRGFRVEPEEIESVLAAHPAVAEAAVVLERGAPEIDTLVAALENLGDAAAEALVAEAEENRA